MDTADIGMTVQASATAAGLQSLLEATVAVSDYLAVNNSSKRTQP